ncbi:hypothetical protein B484DRAFT_449677 [Ochromonadaceae sp. CCMP2298]|nr:hypothetical protein B484DRAFT_449677 [Ochromonadaceae sp. CCMP2298]
MMLAILATLLLAVASGVDGFFGLLNKAPRLDSKVPGLIALAENTKRGLISTSNAEIMSLVDEIEALNVEQSFQKKLVQGQWEALWTTEKETLFFAKNGLFGTPVTRIFQTIDLDAQSINNVIEFGEREFSVLGSLQQSAEKKEGRKLDFSFKSATLKISPLSLKLPPVGKGWFENVFVNDQYRLSKDIRGDYLISKRVQ